MADLDKLQIEIQASSVDASEQVKKLTEAMKTLKASMNFSAENPAKKVKDSVSGSPEEKISRLAKSLQEFKNIGNVGNFKSLANSISVLSGAANAITTENTSKLLRLGNALKYFREAKEAKINPKLADNIVTLAASLNEVSQDNIEKIKLIKEAFSSDGEGFSPQVADSIAKIGKYDERIGNVADYLLGISQLDFSNLTSASNVIGELAEIASSVRSSNLTSRRTTGKNKSRLEAKDSEEITVDSESEEQNIESLNSKMKSLKDSIMQSNSLWKTFRNAASSALDSTSAKANETSSKVSSSFKTAFNSLSQTGLVKSFSSAFSGIGKEAAEHLRPITNAFKYVGATIAQPFVAGAGKIRDVMNGFRGSVDETQSKAASLNNTFKRFSIASAIGKAIRSIRGLGNESNKTQSKLGALLSSIKRIAFYRGVRRAIQMISQAFKDGTKNLYEYSKVVGTDFHRSLDSIATDALYIKNSFAAAIAPIVNALVPVFNALADAIASAANMLARFFAILTGASSYTRATRHVTEYGKAVSGAGKAAKEAVKYLAPFDELNVLPESKSGGGGGGYSADDYKNMFEEVSLNGESLSDSFKKIFEVFEKSWKKNGQVTINKIKKSLQNIKGLLISIGKSFAEVFTNGTGEKTLDHLFGILGGIFDVIGNIAEAFRKAWDTSGLGTSIVQGIWNIFNDVLGFFDDIIAITANWAKSLNFEPLLSSVNDLLKAFEPLVSIISDGLKWAYENVLLPFAKWTIEEALPIVIKTLASAFEFLTAVLNALAPVLKPLWENVLKPFFAFIGNLVLDGLEELNSLLKDLADLINGKISWSEFVKGLNGVKVAFLALGSAIVLNAIGSVVLAVSRIPASIAAAIPKAKAGLSALAATIKIGALAAVDAYLIYYDVSKFKELNDSIETAQKAHQHEMETSLNAYAKLYKSKGKETADEWARMVHQIDTTNMSFEEAQKAITGKVESYWDGVPKNMWEGFEQGWSDYFGQDGHNLFTLVADGFTGLIGGIADLLGIHSPSTVFANFGKNCVLGFQEGFEKEWTNVSSWMNRIIKAAKDKLNSVANAAKSITKSSGSSKKSNVTYSEYASGGYVSSGELFVAREAGPELVGTIGNRTAVANNGQITEAIASATYRAFASALSQYGGSGNKPVNIYLDGKQIATSTTKYQRQYARANG